MKRLLAITLIAALMAASLPALAASEPSDWAKEEIDTYADTFLRSEMGEFDYTADITREEFAVLALHIYNVISPNEIPEMSLENPFTDCDNPLVLVAYGLGLVKGVSDTEFMPEEKITREQMCTIIGRMADSDAAGDESALEDFSDGASVSDWAKSAVALCVEKGIIKGTDEGKLEPLGNCTTEQALIIAKRMKSGN